MTLCAQCGARILWGGVLDGGYRFCSDKCRSNCGIIGMCKLLSDDVVHQHLLDLHAGPCPLCGGSGPVDVHTAHRVWSMLILTSWSSSSRVCCRSCGVKHQVGSIAFCTVLGWWGFPAGLAVTPIQIVRNLVAMLNPPNPDLPSVELEHMLREGMASELLALSRMQVEPAATATQGNAVASSAAAPPTAPQVVPRR